LYDDGAEDSVEEEKTVGDECFSLWVRRGGKCRSEWV